MTHPESSSDNSPADNQLVPVVAIGAAAGGLRAAAQLLENLPATTGLAYVYIQHMVDAAQVSGQAADGVAEPSPQNTLISRLSQVTPMPVLEARHELRVLPDHVYVMPTGQTLGIIDGVLLLEPQEGNGYPDGQTTRLSPIDQFFVSLAERQKNGSVAVLLSGADADGTLGLKAIKVAGGITFAQDETAQFRTMPQAAIAEGVVDKVLSPSEIAQELTQLSQRSDVLRQVIGTDEEEDAQATEEELRTIIQLLRRATGVDFSQYKKTTIRRRIIRRMLLYKLETLKAYAQYLRQHPTEAGVLYNDLLINVTMFFRDTETMDYLSRELLPRLVRNRSDREPLRIWVAACSTGEEAYSLAMMLVESLKDQVPSVPIHIFATDLSETAIARARQGSYTRSEVTNVSPKRLQRFFTKMDDQYRINKFIRDMCVFAPHNLFKDPPFSRLDLISCRNLLIYLESPLQKKAFSIFHYALNPTGYLVLGKSETVGVAANLFSPEEKNYKVYVRNNDHAGRAAFQLALRPGAGMVTSSDRPTGSRRTVPLPNDPVNDLDRIVDTLLLTQYVPASVVVDQNLEILQFRGATGQFLEHGPGRASLNLLKLARPSLTFELRNIVHKAQKSGEPVMKEGLEISVNGKTTQVAIEAILLSNETVERLFLIIFREIMPTITPDTGSASTRNRRIKQLEDELAAVRSDMHSIIEEQEASNEELQSANEEVVSSNEELQSINEELETSKEEIESTNEELLTINQELQVRNDQLSESYDFAEAIFATIRESTLLLDKDLRVKSANRAFYRTFLVDEDTTEGRLLYELGSQQWNIPQLRAMLDDVVNTNAQFQGFELTYSFPDVGEKTMRLNARKVIAQNRQEAILLAIEDTTEDQRAQRLLAEREAWFRTIANSAPSLIWASAADGRYTFLNQSWLNFTGQSPEGMLDWVELLHPDDRQQYTTTFQTHLQTGEPFSIEYRLCRYDNTYRWLQENAQPLQTDDGRFTGFIGTAVDIHLQKELNQELDRQVRQRTQELSDTNVRLEGTNSDLLQANELVKSILDSVPVAIARFRAVRNDQGEVIDFRAIPMNAMMERLSNGAVNEWQPFRNLFPSTDLTNLFEQFKRVVETGEPLTGEPLTGEPLTGEPLTGEPLTGEPLTGEPLTGEPLTGEPLTGEPLTVEVHRGQTASLFLLSAVRFDDGLLAVSLDITQRKQAEDTLQQTVESLRIVLDSSPASIGFLKAIRNGQGELIDFRLAVCNQKFADLIGQSINELSDQLVSQLTDALWGETSYEILRTVITTGKPDYQERAVRTGTEERWIGMAIIKQDDGVVLNGLDITALKEAEQGQERWLREVEASQESIQTLAQLNQQIRERGEFLRETTHDLRGSFGVVLGAASMLDLLETDEERAQILSMLQRNLRQTAQMLTQLLDYSRLEAGQEPVQVAPFDAAVLLRELSESLQVLADERQLQIDASGPPALPVTGDAMKVHRIAQNLLLNALKYTTEGGVTVRWGPDDNAADRWLLTIEDTGPGLPPSKLALLTDWSVAGDTAPTPEPTSSFQMGEGIGLRIVQQLCRMLNAEVTVDSQPGMGTRFRVSLPIV